MNTTMSTRGVLRAYLLLRLKQSKNQRCDLISMLENQLESIDESTADECTLEGEKEFANILLLKRIHDEASFEGLCQGIEQAGRPERLTAAMKQAKIDEIFKDKCISWKQILTFMEFALDYMKPHVDRQNIQMACAIYEWIMRIVTCYRLGSNKTTIDCWIRRKGGLNYYDKKIGTGQHNHLLNNVRRAVLNDTELELAVQGPPTESCASRWV